MVACRSASVARERERMGREGGEEEEGGKVRREGWESGERRRRDYH